MPEFQSEPYRQLLFAHTRLNNYIKISTAALSYLFNKFPNNAELSTKISQLIIDAGERWTQKLIEQPRIELEKVQIDLSKSAVMWAYSGFDVYFKQIEGALSEYFQKPNSLPGEVHSDYDDEERAHKIIELYQKLNWDCDQISDLIIVIKFYEALRHAVAHNLGKPTTKLQALGNDQDFLKAIQQWPTKFKDRAISAPPLIDGQEIQIRPHHALMYSEACLRIARDIDRRLLKKKVLIILLIVL